MTARYFLTTIALLGLAAFCLYVACLIGDPRLSFLSREARVIGVGLHLTMCLSFFALWCLVPLPRADDIAAARRRRVIERARRARAKELRRIMPKSAW